MWGCPHRLVHGIAGTSLLHLRSVKANAVQHTGHTHHTLGTPVAKCNNVQCKTHVHVWCTLLQCCTLARPLQCVTRLEHSHPCACKPNAESRALECVHAHIYVYACAQTCASVHVREPGGSAGSVAADHDGKAAAEAAGKLAGGVDVLVSPGGNVSPAPLSTEGSNAASLAISTPTASKHKIKQQVREARCVRMRARKRHIPTHTHAHIGTYAHTCTHTHSAHAHTQSMNTLVSAYLLGICHNSSTFHPYLHQCTTVTFMHASYMHYANMDSLCMACMHLHLRACLRHA